LSTLEQTNARFETTNWTEIQAFCAGGEEERREGLEILVRRYWPPVYAQLRRGEGLGREEAAEVTASFFAEIVVGNGLFEKARRERGKLRSFLMKCMQNHLHSVRRKERVRGSLVTISMEEIDRVEEKLARESEERAEIFERWWAKGLLEEALLRAKGHYLEKGKRGHWGLFEEWVLRPAATGNQPPRLGELCSVLGFESAAAGAAALQVVKKMVLKFLRDGVEETVGDPAEVEGEFRLIQSLLGEG